MNSHYHLVIKTGSVPLWRSMARLQGKVARGHNRRRRYLGRLWQSRYKARIIDSNQYFRQVVAYVHLNPVAAGIVSDPAKYIMSGHREAIGRSRPMLLDVNSLLAAFGEPDQDRARNAYLEWVRLVAEERWLQNGIADLPWWQDARHTGGIVDAGRHDEAETFDGERLDDERPLLELDELAIRFQQASGYDLSRLASRCRKDRLTEGRIEMTAIAVGRFGHRVSEVATLLHKNPGTVSRWLTMADKRSLEDGTYRRHLDDVDRAISAPARPKVIK